MHSASLWEMGAWELRIDTLDFLFFRRCCLETDTAAVNSFYFGKQMERVFATWSGRKRENRRWVLIHCVCVCGWGSRSLVHCIVPIVAVCCRSCCGVQIYHRRRYRGHCYCCYLLPVAAFLLLRSSLLLQSFCLLHGSCYCRVLIRIQLIVHVSNTHRKEGAPRSLPIRTMLGNTELRCQKLQ